MRVYVYKEHLGPDGLPEVASKLIRVFGSRSPSLSGSIFLFDQSLFVYPHSAAKPREYAYRKAKARRIP